MEVTCLFTCRPAASKPIPIKSPEQSSYDTGSTITSEMQSTITSTTADDTGFSSVDTNMSFVPLQHQKPFIAFTCIASLKTPNPQISCLAVHHNALYAACFNEINVFDLSNYTIIDTLSCNDSSSGLVKSIAFNKNKIFTSHQDGKIRVWKLSKSKQSIFRPDSKFKSCLNGEKLSFESASVRHCLVSTLPTLKDRLKRCMLEKNYIQVRRHKKQLWIEHVDTISGLAVNDVEGLMYSVSWDKSLKIWNISDQRCLESIQAHADAINGVAVSSDGIVYTASADRKIRVWKRVKGERKHKLVTTLFKHKSNVNALALKDDGSVLFSGGGDGLVLVWEREESAEEMVLAHTLSGHAGAVLCLIYVNDLLISGSSDRTVRIWQRRKDCGYSCLVVLEGHSKSVKSVVAAVSGGRRGTLDGVMLIFSGTLDGEIKVWEVLVSNLNSINH